MQGVSFLFTLIRASAINESGRINLRTLKIHNRLSLRSLAESVEISSLFILRSPRR